MAQIGGLDIPLSTRGVTGLHGVAYTPTGHPQRPYVASMNRAEVDQLTNGAMGLDSSAYGYGGGSFHLGYFNDPRVAAWVRADFKNNPVPYVKAFQQARQQGNRGNLADLYQPPAPSDLDNIPLRPIADAVKEYEATRKRGGSEQDAIAAAEAQRQANLDHISKSQEVNQSQDRASDEIQNPKSPLFGILKKIPAEDRGEAMDLISAGLKSGKTPQMIHSELSGWLAESRFRRHMNMFK